MKGGVLFSYSIFLRCYFRYRQNFSNKSQACLLGAYCPNLSFLLWDIATLWITIVIKFPGADSSFQDLPHLTSMSLQRPICNYHFRADRKSYTTHRALRHLEVSCTPYIIIYMNCHRLWHRLLTSVSDQMSAIKKRPTFYKRGALLVATICRIWVSS